MSRNRGAPHTVGTTVCGAPRRNALVPRQKELFDALTTTHSLYSVPLVLPKYGVVASAGWDAPALTFRLLTMAVAGTAVEVASPRNFIVMLYV